MGMHAVFQVEDAKTVLTKFRMTGANRVRARNVEQIVDKERQNKECRGGRLASTTASSVLVS